MDILLSPQAWIGAGLIFMLRVGDMTLDTIRTLMVMRGRRAAAWFLGFFQALIFVLALGSVLRDLNNPLNVLSYAAGFASGNVLGMLIEERLAVGNTYLRIVSSRRGAAIAEGIRAEGYAVTEIPARGKDGMVSLINCSVYRKHARKIQALVNEVDPEAFITAEEIRPVRRGFWRA